MDRELVNHLRRCRCCLKLLRKQKQVMEITADTRRIFFELVGIGLSTSQTYSNTICDVCQTELDRFNEFKQKMVKNQNRLKFFVHNELPEIKKQDWYSSNVKEEPVEDITSILDFENFQDHFGEFEMEPSGVIVKEEEDTYVDSLMQETNSQDYSTDFTDISKTEYEDDIQTVNVNGKTQFQCGVCSNLFQTRFSLKHHMNTTHQNNNQSQADPTVPRTKRGFACQRPGCLRVFSNRKSLKNHIEMTHEPKLKVYCPQCNAQFATHTKVRQHIRRQHHAVLLPCQVPGCQHKTRRKEYLKMHYKNHRGISNQKRAQLLEELKNIKQIYLT